MHDAPSQSTVSSRSCQRVAVATSRIAAGLAVLTVMLVITGYHFPSSIHTTLIPPIMAKIDVSLYQNDYFVNRLSGFSEHTYYIWTVYALIKAGLSLPVSFFVLYLVSFAGYLAGAFRLGRIAGGSTLAGALCAGFAVAVIPMVSGVNGPLLPTSMPQTCAVPVAVWGLCYCLRGRWAVGYGLFGVAGLYSFQVGVLLAIAVLPAMLHLSIRVRSWRQIARALGGYCVLASAVAMPLLLTGGTGGYTHGVLNPSGPMGTPVWSGHETFHFIAFLAAGFAMLWAGRDVRGRARVVMQWFLVSTTAAMVCSFLFTGWWPFASGYELHSAGITPYSQLVILAVLAAVVLKMWREGRPICAVAVGITPLIEYGGLCLLCLVLLTRVAERAEVHPDGSGWSAAWGSATLTLGAVFTLIIGWVSPTDDPDRFGVLLAGVSMFGMLSLLPSCAVVLKDKRPTMPVVYRLAGLCALVVLVTCAIGQPGARGVSGWLRARVVVWGGSDDGVIALAGRFGETSAESAVVLVPPSAEMFKLYARRADVVNYRGALSRKTGDFERQRRVEDVLGGLPDTWVSDMAALDRLYADRGGMDLLRAAVQYEAGYILSRWHTEMPGCRVYDREGAWILYEVDLDLLEERGPGVRNRGLLVRNSDPDCGGAG